MGKVIHLHTHSDNYDILIGKLSSIALASNRKVLIITNPTICAMHITKLLPLIESRDVFVYTINDGEQYKNLSTIENILEVAFGYQLDRDSLIIAFGGGVISDISGFVASIYHRGIDFISIPTTLLAQVDASIGGKTGINNSFGKNLIGTFHQPRAVYIDTSFLSTLPERELYSGISEIIKMAICFDVDFFNWLENANLLGNPSDLEYAIYRSVEIKANVVSIDEKENNIRAILNYGHTFGHVVELLGNYSLYSHGESVSIGMCKANNLSILLGKLNIEDSSRITRLLSKYHLPTVYKVDNVDDFYSRFFLDKKSRNGSLRFIIPCGIGKAEIIENPPKQLLYKAIQDDISH